MTNDERFANKLKQRYPEAFKKPYFAKYLPVEGETDKAYDFGHPERGAFNIIGVPESHIGLSDTCKKVKLFLCSRDRYTPDVNRLNCSTDDEYYKKYPKVIGEISPDALWVKEGDEFDEKDVILFSACGVAKAHVKGPCGHFH